MIDSVIFDVDGVLRTLEIEPLVDILPKEILDKYPGRYDGVTLRDYFSAFLHNKIFEQFDYGNVSREEMAKNICLAFNEPYEVLEYLLVHRLARNKNIIFQPTLNFIKKIRKAGFKTFILSNMGIDIATVLREYLGEENFNDIIFSSEVHMIKPNPDIYDYAVKRFGIKPENSLFVDDREINLKPFKTLGGNVFQFNPKDIEGSVQKLEDVLSQSGFQKQ